MYHCDQFLYTTDYSSLARSYPPPYSSTHTRTIEEPQSYSLLGLPWSSPQSQSRTRTTSRLRVRAIPRFLLPLPPLSPRLLPTPPSTHVLCLRIPGRALVSITYASRQPFRTSIPRPLDLLHQHPRREQPHPYPSTSSPCRCDLLNEVGTRDWAIFALPLPACGRRSYGWSTT